MSPDLFIEVHHSSASQRRDNLFMERVVPSAEFENANRPRCERHIAAVHGRIHRLRKPTKPPARKAPLKVFDCVTRAQKCEFRAVPLEVGIPPREPRLPAIKETGDEANPKRQGEAGRIWNISTKSQHWVSGKGIQQNIHLQPPCSTCSEIHEFTGNPVEWREAAAFQLLLNASDLVRGAYSPHLRPKKSHGRVHPRMPQTRPQESAPLLIRTTESGSASLGRRR